MLIRIGENLFKELPDELAALMLSDPICEHSDEEFSVDEVNAMVHGILGTHYDFSFSYEENINKIKSLYKKSVNHDTPSFLSAKKSISLYNKKITKEQIGLIDRGYLFPGASGQDENKTE